MSKKEIVNKKTGEILSPSDLNKVVIIETKRPKGNVRIQQDFSNCPTLTEQHTAHLTDVNYLIERYKPDELAAYIAARNSYRQEILGHDFSQEPSLQDSMNAVVESRRMFEELDPEIQVQFKSPVEFLKFIDNPGNLEKMEKMGIVTRKQIEKIENAAAPVVNDSPVPGGLDGKSRPVV